MQGSSSTIYTSSFVAVPPSKSLDLDPSPESSLEEDNQRRNQEKQEPRENPKIQESRQQPSIATIFFLCTNISAYMRKFGLSLKRKRPVAEKLQVEEELFAAPAMDHNMTALASLPSHPNTVAQIPQTPQAVLPNPTSTDTLANNFKIFSLESRQKDYEARRLQLTAQDLNESWDAPARKRAGPMELRAAKIVMTIREHERLNLFGNVPSEAIPGPETRDMGGQFLTNKSRIDQSKLFHIAKLLPKGCHLHLHFNAELDPDMLIETAIKNPCMFVRTTQPIVEEKDWDETEVVFSVLPITTETADIFSADYKPAFRGENVRPWMSWRTFREEYMKRRPSEGRPEDWIRKKLILTENETYGIEQTCNGIWARFNQATRCFKGLINYESIYRWYIGTAIESMIHDKVMYAELRPMLMDKWIPSDDGTRQINHYDQMVILLEEVEKTQARLRQEGRFNDFPFGFKIIYCAPRSIPDKMMEREIQDCITLKKQFPKLICGFDLVGAEDRKNSIGHYYKLLTAMQDQCEREGIEIPFMFHAGETLLDTGGSDDPAKSNLYDALLLNAKRIGHGFALLKHPVLVEQYKNRPHPLKPICIELCPTSNELLRLCRCIKEHPYPEILAAGLPCTINSDNPSLFTNNLSYEFYQVMVGSPLMTIHGWKQLAEWSIEYSCLDEYEKVEAHGIFQRAWEEFCVILVHTYEEYANGLVQV